MKFDLYLYHPRPEEMAARVRQAESGGFDGLFVAESGGFDGLFVAESTADPFQCLAVAALHLPSLTLGTSVALAFPRSPMVTAMAAWDLQRARRGRFVLGLGSQVRRHIERRFSAPFAPPAARLREYAQAVRQASSSRTTAWPRGRRCGGSSRSTRRRRPTGRCCNCTAGGSSVTGSG